VAKKSSLKVIFLGGLNEVGKNIMVLEKDNNIIIIDCGIMFPDDYLPGIDFLIPDFYHIRKNLSKVRALVLTHGHEDHIGAIPFLFRDIDPGLIPIYATRLTAGLIKSKLDGPVRPEQLNITEINTDDRLQKGPFELQFFRVNHSIPDNVGIIIRTDIGNIVHSGDFKFDQYPIDGKFTEYSKLTDISKEGVLALFCDSTNAEESGFTLSEREVGRINLNRQIKELLWQLFHPTCTEYSRFLMLQKA